MRKQILFCSLVIALITSTTIYAQVTTAGNAAGPGGAADYVGWDVFQGFPLSIKHEAAQPINFYTNAGVGTLLNRRMTILANTGHVGIGLNFAPGNDALDILPDANFPNTGYGTNNQTVLQNWGTANIFCGVGAGAANTIATSNTFVGNNAGNANTTGGANTFIGQGAGLNNISGISNVFVGHSAGLLNSTGNYNAFMGDFAGRTSTGVGNTSIGYSSGGSNGAGTDNTYVGYVAQGTSGLSNATNILYGACFLA